MAVAVSTLALTACTSPDPGNKPDRPQGGSGASGAYQLVSFPDCGAALAGLRTAARDNVLAWGLGHGFDLDSAAGGGARADAAGAPAAAQQTAPEAGGAKESREGTGYSGTNTHEAGIDEPDLVKTDGKRIITVQNNVLRVIDTASRTQVGRLDLRPGGTATDRGSPYEMDQMLLSGDRVLLIGATTGYHGGRHPDVAPTPQLTLVDLAGGPRVVGRFGMDGGLVDARQVGSTVRVVMRSVPNIERPRDASSPEAYTTGMLHAINKAELSDWLPRYTLDEGGSVSTGRVDCSAVAHPTEYSAASMLTVLTFDLGRDKLGTGDPVTVAADGDTVYSNGPSLYVASDQRWRAGTGDRAQTSIQQRTEIYKFDTSRPGRPSFVGGGAVDGWLLNQYSMSDWNGHLRVATTTGFGGRGPASESTVYVLRQDGRQLTVAGKVGGLGKGERIYSVRFVGGTGYVVTFRQTDPLYTVDLRDPAKPVVTGELKITGYSAYLHPAGDGRLLGIGQEASEQGRTQGTQISLFDVSNPAAPNRLAQYHVKGAHSEAEFDPHAFLYWPQTGLLVVPMTSRSGSGNRGTGALALRIADGAITELGFIEHPRDTSNYPPTIRRSLVIEGTLWTVSPGGLLASDLGNATRQAWVPFT